MGSNGSYSVKINAVGADAAVAELRKINKELAAQQAPLKALQKEQKKFEDLSGITAKNKAQLEADKAHQASMKKTFAEAEKLNDKLSDMAGKALKASGAILGIGALGSVAGIVALSRSFGSSSLGLSNMSQSLSISTDKLLRYRNAMERVGVSSDAFDSSAHDFGMKNAGYRQRQD